VRAVVHDRYGPPEVQRVEEVEKPVPKDDEALVRVRATTVNRTDCGLRAAKPFVSRFFTGLRRPKNRTGGMEFAGVVEAVGPAVTGFAVGDEVFGVKSFGAHAEYLAVRESGPIAHKPSAMSFEEAAAIPDGAALALACYRKADLRKGQKLLVYGATGSVGTAGVQLARHLGADVTAVGNTQNLELVRSLGADRVIDYTQEDFRKHGESYDVVFDAVGKLTFARARGSVKPGGVFVGTDGFLNLFLALPTRWIGSKRVQLGITKYSKEDVLLLKQLVEAGEYRAVIDRRYPLEDVVEATRYVETGQKTGNVVLTL
jgi:NADPH:quinone reductase-like Zn-dependent oxidoreductase